MMGSKKKVKTIFGHLKDEGVGAEILARVDAPIGIAINSVTPQEIAVSIMAQLINVRRANCLRE